jgi:hypothetical protein
LQFPAVPPTQVREPPQSDACAQVLALQVPDFTQEPLPQSELTLHWHLPETHTPLEQEVVHDLGWHVLPLPLLTHCSESPHWLLLLQLLALQVP